MRIFSDFSDVVLVFVVFHLEKTVRLAFHIGFEVGNICKGTIGSPSSELLHSGHLTMAWTQYSVLLALWPLEKINWQGRLINEWYFEEAPPSY